MNSSLPQFKYHKEQSMKIKTLFVMMLSLSLITACNTRPITETSLPDSPIPIIETTLPDVSQITGTESTEISISGSAPVPEGGITLEDRGKTFTMQVGASFLLNLGMDFYEWTVTVDNENVLRRELNVAVIQGAQGIYQALTPGTTTISATGNPLCLQSTPPCASPSILFTVTVVVN
jgi:hypothetical protein